MIDADLLRTPRGVYGFRYRNFSDRPVRFQIAWTDRPQPIQSIFAPPGTDSDWKLGPGLGYIIEDHPGHVAVTWEQVGWR